MKGLRGLIAGLIIGVVAACGAASVAGTGNDTVLHEDSYSEFYKQEGHGDKNYLFTRTEVVDAPTPGKCVVIAGASERTLAMWCNDGSR